MKISEMIKVLEQIMATEGDLRVACFDEYMANEGWDYEAQDLWPDAHASVDMVTDDDDHEIEKVVNIY